MVEVNNTDIQENVRKQFRNDSDSIKNLKANDTIIPIVDVTTKGRQIVVNRVIHDTLSTNTYTCSTTKRTFISSVSFAYSKDANSDAVDINVNATPSHYAIGQTLRLIDFLVEPTTAGSGQTFNCYNEPIELQKGSALTVACSSATASIDMSITYVLYEIDEV